MEKGNPLPRVLVIFAMSTKQGTQAYRDLLPGHEELRQYETVKITSHIDMLRGWRPDLIIATQPYQQGKHQFDEFPRFGRGSVPKPVWLLNYANGVEEVTDTTTLANRYQPMEKQLQPVVNL